MSEGARPYRLLMVCTGNICRSPMAQGLAPWLAEQRGRVVHTRGGSTLGLDGNNADPNSVAVCAELGVDIAGHRASPISAANIEWADFVLVMEYAHASHIRSHYGEVIGEKLFLLGNFGGVAEIADPIGGWRYQFRRTRDEIQRCVEAFLTRLPPLRTPDA